MEKEFINEIIIEEFCKNPQGMAQGIELLKASAHNRYYFDQDVFDYIKAVLDSLMCCRMHDEDIPTAMYNLGKRLEEINTNSNKRLFDDSAYGDRFGVDDNTVW